MPSSNARRQARAAKSHDVADVVLLQPPAASHAPATSQAPVALEAPAKSQAPVAFEEAHVEAHVADGSSSQPILPPLPPPRLVPPPPPLWPPPLTCAEAARMQAQHEGLTLLSASNKTGFVGVRFKELERHPYKAWYAKAGRVYHLGYFGSAEEAALAVARKRQALGSCCSHDVEPQAKVRRCGNSSASPTLQVEVNLPVERVPAVVDVGATSVGPTASSADSACSGAPSDMLATSAAAADDDVAVSTRKRKMTATLREARRRCKARAKQRKLGLQPSF